MWWEDGAVAAVQPVALLRRPVLQFLLSVEPVNEAILRDVSGSREHGHYVFRRPVFL